jgi:hypothetical protein
MVWIGKRWLMVMVMDGDGAMRRCLVVVVVVKVS